MDLKSNEEISRTQKLRVGAAVKEGCRILATVFLSLLLPLSFLLLARLSTARYFSSQQPHLHNGSFLVSLFFKSQTTLILSILVSLVTIAAFARGVTGSRAVKLLKISKRRRLYCAWVLLLVIQLCLSLGIHGTIEAEINSYTVGRLVLPRRVFLVLGLHKSMVFWWRNVVKLVVDETFGGFAMEEVNSVEKVVMAVAFGNLWWRRLRDEAEALVVLPRVMEEMRMDVGVADVGWWWLYYLTVAIGVVKGVAWVVTRIFRCWKLIPIENTDPLQT